MSWKNVRLIFKREARDQLRDRRTLFMVAILPLLLYPALGIGMVQMMVLFSEQPRQVLILGTDDLPESPPLISSKSGQFLNSYFNNPASDADKLQVITDTELREQPSQSPGLNRLLEEEETLRELSAELARLNTAKREWLKIPSKERPETFAGDPRISEIKKRLASILADGPEIVIVVPRDFAVAVSRANQQIAKRAGATAQLEYSRPQIVENSADERSRVAAQRVREVLTKWEESILKQRLELAELPQHLPQPVNPTWIDVAEDKQLSAFVWSRMFPALLVIMAVTGAFYPAVDLAAGEKERGTMETLLICPASRTEIVLGKFLTVMLFSVATAVLNLISMGLTSKYLTSVASSGTFAQIGSLEPPSLLGMCWIALLLLPLSALFSALCLALATFARSTKEGQYYLTPLLMVTLGLTIFCLSPGIQIGSFYSMMPIVGVALLLKQVLTDPTSPLALYYALPVLLASIAYSLAALWWAIDQFAREDVLFREAERFSVRLWVRHLLRDKEATPSFAEGAYCFGLVMLMQFGSMKFMMQATEGLAGEEFATRSMQLLMVQQLVIIASPALFMGIMLTTDFIKTFRLRWPHGKYLVLALTLPLLLHPLSLTLSAFLNQSFFPPLPPSFVKRLQVMTEPGQPLPYILLTFAVLPGICEELCYRGFILSGLSRGRRLWLAIAVSSLLFGLMHMIPQQVFNATLLGLVLGLLAIRSGSLLPSVVFHILWNSLAILHGRVGALPSVSAWAEQGVGQHLISVNQGQIAYQWPVLLVAAVGAVVAIRYLFRQPTSEWALPDVEDAEDDLPGQSAEAQPGREKLASNSVPAT